MLAGCQDPLSGGAGLDAVPEDFALVFAIEPAENAGLVEPAEPTAPLLRRRAVIILEADRTLRAAVGEAARPRLYPDTTAILSPARRDALYRYIADAGLLTPGQRADERPSDATGPRYRVAITAHGRTVRHHTPADRDDALTGLLHRLADLSGLRSDRRPSSGEPDDRPNDAPP